MESTCESKKKLQIFAALVPAVARLCTFLFTFENASHSARGRPFLASSQLENAAVTSLELGFLAPPAKRKNHHEISEAAP